MLQTKEVEKIKTHFVFNNFFFSENRAVCETMWVLPQMSQITKYNTAHKRGDLHTERLRQEYRHS